ncbi:MAG: hypothetical protein E6G06_14950 [Actinobacteria bacterium]|nr:MAG: hypothetical protein E6G06_14950 [Actinomycetota bacterium]
MSSGDGYSTDAARAAADREELGEWVAKFLRSPGSDNADLADLLSDKIRWWLGPVQVPLDQLNRLAGPPGAPVVRAIDEGDWRDDIDDLSRDIQAGLEPPPVIVSYRDDQLVLEDGNHRVEALRRAGANQAWAVIGFEDPDERARFVARSEAKQN